MEVIGHKTQWGLLKKMIASNRIPHSMLFAGQEHLGKKRVALEFIKLLNCEVSPWSNFPRAENPRNEVSPEIDSEACQKCLECSDTEKGIHPDLYFIEPPKKASSLGISTAQREIQIDQIRDLKKALSLHPLRGRFKSVLVDDAHTLNTEAQNCLLKTLEEPTANVFFVLISSQPERLRATLRSRTQILKFYPLGSFEMEKYFKGKISPALLPDLLFLSGGQPGKAIEFSKNPEKLNLEIERYKLWRKILTSKLHQRLYFVKQLFDRKEFVKSLESFLETLIKYLRIILLQRLGVKKNNPKGLFYVPENLQNYSLTELKEKIEIVENLRELIVYSRINPKLALENLMLTL